MIHRLLLIFVLLGSVTSSCLAELQPDEIAIVAARGSRESEALAKYYARVRKIPADHICAVDMPRGEVCPRETWTWAVRPEIHKWLVENDPDEKIRCLVTVWDVPLKIGGASSDASLKKYQTFLEEERAHRLEMLGEVLVALQRMAPDDDATSGGAPQEVADAQSESDEADRPAITTIDPSLADQPADGSDAQAGSSRVKRLQAQLESALQRAQRRLASIPEGDQRKRSQAQLQQLATLIGGINVLLPAMNQQLTSSASPNPKIRSEFDVMRGRGSALIEAKSLLEQMPPDIHHDAMVLALLERFGGLLGSLQWLDEQIANVVKNESGASFDSELSLVMWPDDYQLLRWQPNYLRPSFDNSQLPKFFRTLMVARIDAPTLRLAKGLIDTAIEVEKKGLDGKVYIDARGLAKLDSPVQQQGSYADFDRALLVTAKGIKELTDMEVILEDTPNLFQAGQCPDAALYCGWYSVGKYVDAFDWVPGAVAYHLASSEAATLRDPESQVWCKKLLEDGVCATIGPVYEPYLVAFPRPEEFFALLLQGDLTLVECYYRTTPFNSWMMTLVGDPLYRPFKNNPRGSR